MAVSVSLGVPKSITLTTSLQTLTVSPDEQPTLIEVRWASGFATSEITYLDTGGSLTDGGTPGSDTGVDSRALHPGTTGVAYALVQGEVALSGGTHTVVVTAWK